VLDILDKSNKAGRDMFLRAEGFQALVIGADEDLGSLNDVPPVIEGVFGGKELPFLCGVA